MQNQKNNLCNKIRKYCLFMHSNAQRFLILSPTLLTTKTKANSQLERKVPNSKELCIA